MTHRPRRELLVIAAAALLAPAAAAQDGEATLIAAMGVVEKAFGDSVKLLEKLGGVAAALRGEGLSLDERARVKAEADDLARALSRVLATNMVIVADLDQYIADARAREATPERAARQWRDICREMETQLGQVAAAQSVLARGGAIGASFGAEERVNLDLALASRAGLLGRLSALPAPMTDAEIAALERLNARYKEVVARTRAARVALEKARDAF